MDGWIYHTKTLRGETVQIGINSVLQRLDLWNLINLLGAEWIVDYRVHLMNDVQLSIEMVVYSKEVSCKRDKRVSR